MSNGRRSTRAAAACLVVGLGLGLAAGACGSTAGTPVGTVSSGVSPTAPASHVSGGGLFGGSTASVTAAPTPTRVADPTPNFSPLTAGFATPEQAIEAWLVAKGFGYSGDCEKGPQTMGTYCHTYSTTRESGRIYLSGPRFSEQAYWLLVAYWHDRWFVAGVELTSDSGEPPAAWT
jgi:hypothetical protein